MTGRHFIDYVRKETPMTFKQLAIGDLFEFDHGESDLCEVLNRSLARGPWIKSSEKRYNLAERASDGYHPTSIVHRVGSAKVNVTKLSGKIKLS